MNQTHAESNGQKPGRQTQAWSVHSLVGRAEQKVQIQVSDQEIEERDKLAGRQRQNSNDKQALPVQPSLVLGRQTPPQGRGQEFRTLGQEMAQEGGQRRPMSFSFGLVSRAIYFQP